MLIAKHNDVMSIGENLFKQCSRKNEPDEIPKLPKILVAFVSFGKWKNSDHYIQILIFFSNIPQMEPIAEVELLKNDTHRSLLVYQRDAKGAKRLSVT